MFLIMLYILVTYLLLTETFFSITLSYASSVYCACTHVHIRYRCGFVCLSSVVIQKTGVWKLLSELYVVFSECKISYFPNTIQIVTAARMFELWRVWRNAISCSCHVLGGRQNLFLNFIITYTAVVSKFGGTSCCGNISAWKNWYIFLIRTLNGVRTRDTYTKIPSHHIT
jgi:hypothetical protein